VADGWLAGWMDGWMGVKGGRERCRIRWMQFKDPLTQIDQYPVTFEIQLMTNKQSIKIQIWELNDVRYTLEYYIIRKGNTIVSNNILSKRHNALSIIPFFVI